MSMLLDGFIVEPNDGIEQSLDDGCERLHVWVYGLVTWRKLLIWEYMGIRQNQRWTFQDYIYKQARDFH